MFLERVYEGKNDIGRWIAMLIIVLIFSQLVGALPLSIMMFLNLTDNPDLEPDPQNYFDFAGYDISPLTGLVLMMIPFVLGLLSLLLLIKPIHERPMLSVITGTSSFRWKKFFWGAGVWFILLTIYSIFATTTGIQKVELQFNPLTLISLVAVSMIFLPFQTGFEEVLFRGYLMQGFAAFVKYKWIALLISAFIFGALHFWNPEVRQYGAMIAMPQYIWFGIFFGICTLMDEGLELAWGVHAINNIFLSIFFTQDSSALQTPALYRITAFNPLFDLIALITLSAVFILFARKKFKWPEWKYLLAKVDKPAVTEEDLSLEYIENEYDEYE